MQDVLGGAAGGRLVLDALQGVGERGSFSSQQAFGLGVVPQRQDQIAVGAVGRP
jgi:hypothetical protein